MVQKRVKKQKGSTQPSKNCYIQIIILWYPRKEKLTFAVWEVCVFGCNLKRCKRNGRRTKSVYVGGKNPRKVVAKKSAVFD